MSYLGADGKRYYRFYNATEHGPRMHRLEQQLQELVAREQLFRLTPLAAGIRRAVEGMRRGY